MAENTRGQNRNDQNRNQESDISRTQGEHSRQTGRDTGLADMTEERTSSGQNASERGSGLRTKRSVTGSDYDGQLSDE